MIADRKIGEAEFERLLQDGMIYFERGQAYDSIGEYRLAKKIYERARELFPGNAGSRPPVRFSGSKRMPARAERLLNRFAAK